MATSDDVKSETANLEPTGREMKGSMESESTEVQITVAMEVPGEGGSLTPIKRKAGDGEETSNETGSDNGDESGSETGEDVGENDESTDDCGSDWEADSFDARNFDPEGSDGDVSDEELKQQHIRYTRQIRQSKGFHVDEENVPDDLYNGVVPLTDLDDPFPPHKSARDLMERLVRLTFDKYNRQNGTELEMVNIVKANWKLNAGPKYYITCMAKESAAGEPKEYQVKVESKFPDGCPRIKNHYILCRPAPQAKWYMLHYCLFSQPCQVSVCSDFGFRAP